MTCAAVCCRRATPSCHRSLVHRGGHQLSPGRETLDHQMVQDWRAPLLDPGEKSEVLESYRLSRAGSFNYSHDHLVLEEHLGKRFRPLRVLSKSGCHVWAIDSC